MPANRSTEKLRVGNDWPVSFPIAKGEVVGLVCGNHFEAVEFARGLYGSSGKYRGLVRFGECPVAQNPAASLDRKTGLVEEDRRVDGIFPNMVIADNISLLNFKRFSSCGFFDSGALSEKAASLVRELAIKCISTVQDVKELSGGNQQKVLLSRWITSDCDTLILIEPTSGIDINGKKDIYTLIRRLKAAGTSFVLVTTDENERRQLCDRTVQLEVA
jgi:ribose transport system ATP-binding protein